MAKKDRDLFDRLRRAGLRKQVARTLSGIGEDASKKAVGVARSAVAELRSLADELERRLPSAAADGDGAHQPARRSASRSQTATPSASRSKAGAGTGRPARQVGKRSPARRRTRAAVAANVTRAPRGQNKAVILRALRTGPKTASEIAAETGISTGTVGSALSKLTTTGEVVKANRGYGLPK